MLIYPGWLEVRKKKGGGRVIRGKFPYNRHAVLTDGGNKGRPVKERFKPRSFAYRLDDPLAEIHLLVGHDYGKPLASKLNGTLTFKDTLAALFLEAVITEAVANTTHGKDILALIGAGLAVGLSPGFRIPPKRTVPDAETIEDEDPSQGRAVIRTINDCLLYEMSVVTLPAYDESVIEEVSEIEEPKDDEDDEENKDEAAPVVARPRVNPARRWRHV